MVSFVEPLMEGESVALRRESAVELVHAAVHQVLPLVAIPPEDIPLAEAFGPYVNELVKWNPPRSNANVA
jgi:hypothetical protein